MNKAQSRNDVINAIEDHKIRRYKAEDFSACVELVNKVWDFDGRFEPQNLSDFFKEAYTAGSLSESNFYIVIEQDRVVRGFLFGRCGNDNLYKNEYSGVIGSLREIFQLYLLKGLSFKKKHTYVKMMFEHQANRYKVEPSRKNEVNLFVVDPDIQGKGYGKKLMHAFTDFCKGKNIKRITLETDKACNMGFYDHLGFKVKGEFYSPLQKEYSGYSGECYVYELVL